MPINSLEFAQKFTGELDKKFEQKAVTGFFLDNAFRAKFVGAKTVLIPDVDFVGLADYDRDTGFSRGAITVANTPFTMSMDRGRSMQIDREDLDETGVANLSGQILGEYVRTKVVPECDAYVLSKLAGLANTRGNTVSGNVSYPFAAFNELVQNVRDAAGYDEELVCFIDSPIYSVLCNSSEISKMITVSDFKQGNINFKVKSIDGVSLIPVTSDRMKTAYEFKNDAAGGFVPANSATETYMLVCPKSAAHLVKKSERLRIFTPNQNLDADAYKFDYRLYYDVFVKKSALDTIFAWLAPAINITAQPSDAEKTEGSISGSISVTVSTEDVTYQWYQCNDAAGNGAVKVSSTGYNTNALTIPTSLEAGKYYYFCKIGLGYSTKKTKVATVEVKSGS